MLTDHRVPSVHQSKSKVLFKEEIMRIALFSLSTLMLLGACQMNTETSTAVDTRPTPAEGEAEDSVTVPQGRVVSARINKPISWFMYAPNRTLTIQFENGAECVAKDLPATVWVKKGVYSGTFPDCPYTYTVNILVGTGPLPGNVSLLVPGERYLLAKYTVTITGEDFEQTVTGT